MNGICDNCGNICKEENDEQVGDSILSFCDELCRNAWFDKAGREELSITPRQGTSG